MKILSGPVQDPSDIVTRVLKKSQRETHLHSPRAKQEDYWAEQQRANESLQEDLPAGLEPAPLGTERSVVSSMPPNEMHRVDMINHLHPFCKRVEHVMEMPDQTWECQADLIFTAHESVVSLSSWQGDLKKNLVKESYISMLFEFACL